jgi:hypothetical protein
VRNFGTADETSMAFVSQSIVEGDRVFTSGDSNVAGHESSRFQALAKMTESEFRKCEAG